MDIREQRNGVKTASFVAVHDGLIRGDYPVVSDDPDGDAEKALQSIKDNDMFHAREPEEFGLKFDGFNCMNEDAVELRGENTYNQADADFTNKLVKEYVNPMGVIVTCIWLHTSGDVRGGYVGPVCFDSKELIKGQDALPEEEATGAISAILFLEPVVFDIRVSFEDGSVLEGNGRYAGELMEEIECEAQNGGQAQNIVKAMEDMDYKEKNDMIFELVL